MAYCDPAELDAAGGIDAPGADWDDRILLPVLASLVSRLPDEMRDVVSLRTGSAMPYGEIAEILGIAEGTARSRMHNAVRLLREQLAAQTQRKEQS
jgi:RNA polymerase sigma factor (sigma-70 family)